MPTYSIKMRASKAGRHVSGAERIISQQELAAAADCHCLFRKAKGFGARSAAGAAGESKSTADFCRGIGANERQRWFYSFESNRPKAG
ncbi:6-carboxyhexanoate--CoA ligase, partial [uncultured Phascolarctobacterium sp.]|uniref:6-carboxyhexanoate--CoA ligase n=1 Tax=uncultured Phascolarctobacterium sp. TaxID=512296 RepID=UPI003454DC01